MVVSGLGVSLLPRSAGTLSVSELAILPLETSLPLSQTGMISLPARKNNSLLSNFRRVALSLTQVDDTGHKLSAGTDS